MPFDNYAFEAPMSVPCEIAVKCVLPVVRAMLAKQLIEEYNLRQAEAAAILGISQPAISLYQRDRRGKAINLEKDDQIVAVIREMAHVLAKTSHSRNKIVPMYCDLCRAVRAKGLMCEIHRAFDPGKRLEECDLCLSKPPLKC